MLQSLVGHILREAFLEPKVVKPSHGNHVAKPLVAGLVQDENVAAEIVALGWSGAEKNAVFVEKGLACVLHSTKREAGNQDQIIFGERKRLCEVAAEVSDTAGGHLLYLGRFLLSADKLRLAHVQGWFA